MTARVFLVDDHEIVRRGIADVIDRPPTSRSSGRRPESTRRCSDTGGHGRRGGS